jgi:hypothetical protein
VTRGSTVEGIVEGSNEGSRSEGSIGEIGPFRVGFAVATDWVET